MTLLLAGYSRLRDVRPCLTPKARRGTTFVLLSSCFVNTYFDLPCWRVIPSKYLVEPLHKLVGKPSAELALGFLANRVFQHPFLPFFALSVGIGGSFAPREPTPPLLPLPMITLL